MMSDPVQNDVTRVSGDGFPDAPQTGHAEIDQALASLADLEQQDSAEHADRIAAVHETVNAALTDVGRG